MIQVLTPANQLIISHFFNYELWIAGKELLDFQIEEKVKGKKNYYNTLNFMYFTSIYSKIAQLSSKKYYKEKIANNAFYALKNEFIFLRYPLPKGAVSIRNFTFFGYPMAVLYQSIGIYIAKITEEFVRDKQAKNIFSYYGGHLSFVDNYKVSLKPANVSYYQQYKVFLKKLEDSTAIGVDKWAIKIDIKDFYDNIDLSILFENIRTRVKGSILTQYKFDINTSEQLLFFFRFLAHGGKGILQADNNIISSYISYLYLLIGDYLIEDCIHSMNEAGLHPIGDYKIIRYVDDIHVILTLPTSATAKQFTNLEFVNTNKDALRIAETPHFLLEKIVNEFYNKLGLTVNDKARVFHLVSKQDRSIFLKRTLLSNQESTPFDISNPKLALKKLILGLELLNKTPLNKTISGNATLDQIKDLLKHAFNPKLKNLLNIDENKRALHKELVQLNFNKCHISPKALTLLISQDEIVEKKFLKFSSQQIQLTISTRNVIVNYLCHKEYSSKNALFRILQNEITISNIVALFKKSIVVSPLTNYGGVKFLHLKRVLNCIPLLEQIRLRSYHELTSNYSICLNLLLNEIHFTCFHLDNIVSDIKNYDVNNVRDFLTKRGVESTLRDQIAALFDRRNNNPFSHPGSDTRHALSVNHTDYHAFKKGVGQTMQKILSN